MKNNLITGFTLIFALAFTACHTNNEVATGAQTGNGVQSNVYVNGSRTLDEDGNPVFGARGCMLQAGKNFYWYGEHYNSNGDVTGISVYYSADLVRWAYRGDILTAESSDEISSFDVNCPKVVYNAATDKYILWAQRSDTNQAVVAWSYSPDSSFTYLKSFRPFDSQQFNVHDNGSMDLEDEDAPYGYMVGDLNLFTDDDGTCYLVANYAANTRTNVYRLTSDYQDVDVTYAPTDYTLNDYITQFASYDKDEFQNVETYGYTEYRAYLDTIYGREYNRQVWLYKTSRQAPCLFKCGSYYFMLSSGINGEAFTPVTYQYSTSIQGPWSDRIIFSDTPGGTDVSGYSTKSDRSQASYVFKLKATDGSDGSTLMYMGDRSTTALGTNKNNTQYVWMKIEYNEETPEKIKAFYSEGMTFDLDKGEITYPQYYYIKNLAGQYLVMPDSTDNTSSSPNAFGGQTGSWTETAPSGDNSSTLWRDQYLYQWRLIPCDSGYQIVNRWSSLALRRGSETSIGSISLVEKDVEDLNQIWDVSRIIKFESDFTVKSPYSDFYLSTGVFGSDYSYYQINDENALFQTAYGYYKGTAEIKNQNDVKESDRYEFQEAIVSVQNRQKWQFVPVVTSDDEF